MKKTTRLILLLGILSALLCVSALAAAGDTETPGIYGAKAATGISNVTITPFGISGSATIGGESVNGFYANAEKLTVSYNAAANDKFYLLIVTNKAIETAPTVDNIVYIDQATATSGKVSFTAYPSALSKGTYHIYLSSNASGGYGKDGLQEIGSFESYVYEAPLYTLGDVNNDTFVNSKDATVVLRAAANLVTLTTLQKAAGDVNGDTFVNAKDATQILRKAAGLSSSLD